MNCHPKRFKVGFDLDDTCWGFMSEFSKFLNAKTAKEITLHEVREYQISLVWEVPESQMALWVHEFANSFALQIKMPKTIGLDNLLQSIQDDECCDKPVAISSRSHVVRDVTLQIMNQLFPDIEFSQLHTIGSYHTDSGLPKICKSEVCNEEGVHLFFEDNYSHSFKIASRGIPVVLFRKPWNIRYEKGCNSEYIHWCDSEPGFEGEAQRIFNYYRNLYLLNHPDKYPSTLWGLNFMNPENHYETEFD